MAILALVMLPAAGAAVPKQNPVRATATLQPGMWQLREASGTTQQLCVTDPEVLLQLGHLGMRCGHAVVENGDTKAISFYACDGHGNGQTTLSVDTPAAVRIATQGVRDGMPFVRDVEARRTGSCGGRP